MLLFPVRFDENAIHRPSGDQTGLSSISIWFVTGTARPPMEGAIQTSPR